MTFRLFSLGNDDVNVGAGHSGCLFDEWSFVRAKSEPDYYQSGLLESGSARVWV